MRGMLCIRFLGMPCIRILLWRSVEVGMILLEPHGGLPVQCHLDWVGAVEHGSLNDHFDSWASRYSGTPVICHCHCHCHCGNCLEAAMAYSSQIYIFCMAAAYWAVMRTAQYG